MEKKKSQIFKILMTILFAGVVFAGYFFVIFGKLPADSSIKMSYISYACVALCFLFSLIFVGVDKKKILITLALATNVVADYFLILNPNEQNKLIGVCIFCGVQFFYFLYTFVLNKSIGAKVTNIALRVGLCLLAYMLLPRYVTLGALEWVTAMYIINFFVNVLEVLCYIKTEWLLLLGLLLFFACDVFVGLGNGGIDLLGITGNFATFVYTYDVAFYCYIPGLFLIASSSVWAGKNKKT